MKRKVCTGFSCPDGNQYWKYTGPILDELCPACDRPLREIESTHGGKRPGAGRPPREDGRKLRTIKVALSGGEFETIKQLSTDQRREAMIDLVTTLMVDQAMAKTHIHGTPLVQKEI